ncbi:GNAT family N-acetyltransferase [Paractinoplanes hotanensis]|uniref:GNAT family N-acetyltransferase n=1 Tax=Paractinoplanes hotanensis TaxID=2906497 RepID=A0ABT0XZJ0_9ACTN|nr:GNAT family N-acetyltransferase [Actinoplanes hotanensis]MCM4079199.1 GNAT family N-acetyltransferase [Actinoplanes hotanensis]
MTAALVGPAAREWKEALHRTRHDTYHLPGYVTLDAALCSGTPAAFWYSDGSRHLLLPLILREIPGTGLRDALSPYGYPGPISDAMPGDRDFWERACAAMLETLRDEGIVTAFVRMHPLLPAPLPLLARFGTMVHHGETVSMDLTVSLDEMWKQTRSDHRNHINRARRDGTEVVFDDWDRLDEWVAVYHDNMRRVGASDYYFFSREHLAAVHDVMGDRMHLAVALEDGEVVGGNTFFEHHGIATGYVSSTRRAPRRYADELLYDEVRRWCKARGDTVFHLGGGKGGEQDSLFSYKAGFSPRRHLFHTWRVVSDRMAYEDLVSAAGRDTGASGTFPPYR